MPSMESDSRISCASTLVGDQDRQLPSDSRIGCAPTLVRDQDGQLSSDIVGPTVLILEGQNVFPENIDSKPLYQLSRSIGAVTHKDSSIDLVRIGRSGHEDDEDASNSKQQNQHLFYLVHPVNAQYRTDVPGYYMTSVSPEMIGNIKFETAKSKLRKSEFKALLSANKSASDNPLFDEQLQETLFSAKTTWNGRYLWYNSEGKQVAHEGGDGNQTKLAITQPMAENMRDAMVGSWVLRLWHDRAEGGQFTKQGKTLLFF